LRMLAVNRDIMIRTASLIAAFLFFTSQGARAGDTVLAANAVLKQTKSFTLSTGDAVEWSQLAYVKGSNTEAFDEFGGSVGLSRDGRTLVVGARGEDSNARGANSNQADNSVDEAGAAYVFTR